MLTKSNTYPSRLIHIATTDPYTHVSIGLEGLDGAFYSFGRKYKRLILPAGLVKEDVTCDSPLEIKYQMYRLRVTRSDYLRVKALLGEMYSHRERYHYNILGMLSVYFNYPLRRRGRYFCSQFVAETLQSCGVVAFDKDTALVRPMDFSHISGLQLVSEGVIGRLGVDRALPCPSEVVAVLPFGHLLLRACRFCVRRRR